MKIYTYVKIDIDTGETLEEEFFEYSGPLALCAEDDTGGYGQRDFGGGAESFAGGDSSKGNESEQEAVRRRKNREAAFEASWQAKVGEIIGNFGLKGALAKGLLDAWGKNKVNRDDFIDQLMASDSDLTKADAGKIADAGRIAHDFTFGGEDSTPEGVTADADWRGSGEGLPPRIWKPGNWAYNWAKDGAGTEALWDKTFKGEHGPFPEWMKTSGQAMRDKYGFTGGVDDSGDGTDTDDGQSSPWVDDPGATTSGVQSTGTGQGLLNTESSYNTTAGKVPQSWLDYLKDPTPENAQAAFLDFNMMTLENPNLRPDELYGKLGSIVGDEDANLIINQGKTGAATSEYGAEIDKISSMTGPNLSFGGKLVRNQGGGLLQVKPTRTMKTLGDLATDKHAGLLKGYTKQNDMGEQRITNQQSLIDSIMKPRYGMWEILQGDKAAMDRVKQAGKDKIAYADAANPKTTFVDWLFS